MVAFCGHVKQAQSCKVLLVPSALQTNQNCLGESWAEFAWDWASVPWLPFRYNCLKCLWTSIVLNTASCPGYRGGMYWLWVKNLKICYWILYCDSVTINSNQNSYWAIHWHEEHYILLCFPQAKSQARARVSLDAFYFMQRESQTWDFTSKPLDKLPWGIPHPKFRCLRLPVLCSTWWQPLHIVAAPFIPSKAVTSVYLNFSPLWPVQGSSPANVLLSNLTQTCWSDLRCFGLRKKEEKGNQGLQCPSGRRELKSLILLPLLWTFWTCRFHL